MDPFDFQLRLCLGSHVVPVVEETHPVLDPHNLGAELEFLDVDDSLEVSLVSLKATGNLVWLEKALSLPARWWVKHSSKIPLLKEIREVIKDKKPSPSQGSKSRLPREPSALVILKIRERVLLMQNSSSQMHLALTGTPGAPPGSFEDKVGTLKWFCNELQEDIKVMLEEEQQEGEAEEEQEAGPQVPGATVAKSLETLREHPLVLKAHYLPSRTSFKVVKKDKSTSIFWVQGLKKRKLEEDDEDQVQSLFEKAVSAALNTLESSSVPPDQGES